MFYDLGLRIRLRPGDAIFFKSKWLLHGNAPLDNPSIDWRFSFTFFTHALDFKIDPAFNNDELLWEFGVEKIGTEPEGKR